MEMTTNLILAIGIVTSLVLAGMILVIPRLLGGTTKKVAPSSDKEEKKEGKEEGEKNLNQAQKAWVWITDQKEPGRRAFIGWAVLFLILLSLPWVGTVVRFFWYLILMGGVAFWAINLWAEPKVKKERAGKSNKLIYSLATLALLAEGMITFLVHSGADPAIFNPTSPAVKSLVGEMIQKAETKTTETKKGGRIVNASDSQFVVELEVEPGKLSSSFEEVGGQRLLAALKRPGGKGTIEPLNGAVVECYDQKGKLRGKLTSSFDDRNELGLKAAEVAHVRFRSTSKERAIVRLTMTH